MRVRRLGGTRAGEIRITRFLRNKAVTSELMVSSAAARTAQRCAQRHVLAIQDTTVVRSQGGGGLYLHPTIAVDADDGAILGMIHACFLTRESGRTAARRRMPVADKQSQRWLDGAEQAAQICAQARAVTVIADRESDIYAAFAKRPLSVNLLVRAAQNRALGDGGRLFETIDAMPENGRVTLSLPAKPGRPARTAVMAIRFRTVALARPQGGVKEDVPATITMAVVDACEVDPPAGERVHWRLLTTHPVNDLAGALVMTDLYRRRWAIEQLFRTLKTKGFDIEDLRIAEHEPLTKLVTATLIAAVTIQQMVHARDGNPSGGALRPITDAFDERDVPLIEAFCAKLEGKTQRQKNPHPRGSLAYAAWVCARLGGWTGYYGKPGPIVMLDGWQRLQAAIAGVDAWTSRQDV